jgi:phospholipid transport system substrate-binding protein
MISPVAFARSLLLAAALAVVAAPPVMAATPAESFITNNIHQGLDVLNDKALSDDQRRTQFQNFLLGMTDMQRIATFTLGPYSAKASQADRDAFATAFQNYALATYQSYFSKYAGQTLTVTGSTAHGADDFVVATLLVDPKDHSGQPLQVDFRVRTDSGHPVLVDFSVAGIWLALEERDQFVAFLDHNGGSVPLLISHLHDLAQQQR